MADLIERVAVLEKTAEVHDKRIEAMNTVLQAHVSANARTAVLLESTAKEQAGLSKRIDGIHTPVTCPNTVKVSKMWMVYVGAGAIAAVLTWLGLNKIIGASILGG